MVKRRIRIAGQYEFYNGRDFANAVARLYSIDAVDADEIITAIWHGKFPTPEYDRAREAINDPAIDELARTLIPTEDYRVYKISELFEDLEWDDIDPELNTYLDEVRKYFDVIFDPDKFVKGMMHVSDHFTPHVRELAILRTTMMQSGIAADRPPLIVFFSQESGGANEAIAMIMQSLQDFTKGVDTAENPNPAVRLPGEIELIMRRMKQGDAMLLTALHRFDPQRDTLNNYWYMICEEMIKRLGLRNVNTRGQQGRLKFTPQQTIIYIIDYCETYLKANGYWQYLFLQGGVLHGLGRTEILYRRMSQIVQLQLDADTSPETIYKIATFVLTASLNQHSDNGERRGGIPLFSDWLDDRVNEAANSIRVMWYNPNGNQTPQSDARSSDGILRQGREERQEPLPPRLET